MLTELTTGVWGVGHMLTNPEKEGGGYHRERGRERPEPITIS